jgi:copper(I)-binding protein
MGALVTGCWAKAPSLAVIALVTALVATSHAAAARLDVVDAWVRPAAADASDAVYFIVRNRNGAPDTLLRARSPGAAAVSFHISRMAGQVMMMRSLGQVTIPANADVTFAPGGLHLMLEALKRSLKIGDRIELTLTFAHAGVVNLSCQVRSGPPGAGSGEMKQTSM